MLKVSGCTVIIIDQANAAASVNSVFAVRCAHPNTLWDTSQSPGTLDDLKSLHNCLFCYLVAQSSIGFGQILEKSEGRPKVGFPKYS